MDNNNFLLEKSYLHIAENPQHDGGALLSQKDVQGTPRADFYDSCGDYEDEFASVNKFSQGGNREESIHGTPICHLHWACVSERMSVSPMLVPYTRGNMQTHQPVRRVNLIDTIKDPRQKS